MGGILLRTMRTSLTALVLTGAMLVTACRPSPPPVTPPAAEPEQPRPFEGRLVGEAFRPYVPAPPHGPAEGSARGTDLAPLPRPNLDPAHLIALARIELGNRDVDGAFAILSSLTRDKTVRGEALIDLSSAFLAAWSSDTKSARCLL